MENIPWIYYIDLNEIVAMKYLLPTIKEHKFYHIREGDVLKRTGLYSGSTVDFFYKIIEVYSDRFIFELSRADTNQVVGVFTMLENHYLPEQYTLCNT